MSLTLDIASKVEPKPTDRTVPCGLVSAEPVEAPLSQGQYALWLLEQRVPASGAYNLVNAVYLSGKLDLLALERAFTRLAERHDALRTTFVERKGVPVRLTHTCLRGYIEIEDAQAWSSEELSERLNAEVYRPFDMSRGPLVRLLLFRLAPDQWVLLLAMHHSITDLWSIAIGIYELGELYKQEITGKPAKLRPLQADYTEFVRQQERMLSQPEGKELWIYWRDQLAGVLSPLDLPTDYPRPREQTYKGTSQSFILDATLTKALKALSQAEGVSLHVTLLAAFQTLLHRYTGQKDILVGSPKAGREAGFGRLMGYFVNPVVLCARFDEDLRFRDLLAQVQDTITGAFDHDKYPFPVLVERLQPKRDFSRPPIFQVTFAWQKTARIVRNLGVTSFGLDRDGEGLKLGDLPMKPFQLKQRAVPFELSLLMLELDDELGAMLEYNTDLFNTHTIMRLFSHFVSLLRGIVANPECLVSTLPLITEDECQTLLFGWNGIQEDAHPSREEYIAEYQIPTMIEAQALRTPDALAVRCGNSELTYRELDSWANRLARHLHGLGIGPGSRVGLCMERTPEMIAGLLGILKAGAIYVPFDPVYPHRRTAFILQDAQVAAVVTQRRLVERLAVNEVELICIDDASLLARQPDQPFHCPATSSDAAYIIYTSGSNGRPKGVLVSYDAITKHCRDMVDYYQLTPADRVLQFASLDFDASLEQILPTLVAGAGLILRDEAVWTPVEFYQEIREHNLTVIDIPPGYWHQLASGWIEDFGEDGLAQVRLVIVGGDVMRPETLPLWRQTPLSNARLLNAYGPTEATITATTFEVLPGYEPSRNIPIGQPLPNRQTYILDAYRQPVPIGVTGELYLGGAGLAIGYLNHPELTAECFVLNPFVEGERLYRTGDLARYLHDGTIEFMGRADFQVKIRGFRVELDEIAAELRQHPDVQDAVVALREDRTGDPQLVGYVVSRENIPLELHELTGFLKARLPVYMVPAAFVVLDALPMASGIKVDRQALPAPIDQHTTLDTPYVAPSTPVESGLAEIWSQVLRLPKIGRYDNFFELGGDSLKAGQVASRLWQVFKIAVPLRDLFDHPTLEDMAAQIALRQSHLRQVKDAPGAGDAPSLPPLVHRDLSEPIPLSFAQERIWFMHQLAPESSAYNIPEAMRLDGPLNREALQYALAEIMLRHTSLRSAYPDKNGEPVQVIRPNTDVQLRVVDLRSLPVSDRERYAQQLADEEAQRPFDLRRDVLVRFFLFQLEDERYILVFNFHHLVADAQSLGVLVTEVSRLYNSYLTGTPVHLPELPIHYTDFTVWQREWLKGDVLAGHLRYWREQLDGIRTLELPTDYPRPVVQRYHGKSAVYEVPDDLLTRINHLSYRAGASLAMTLLAAFNVLLYRYTGQDDIAVNMPIANRTHHDIENIVGTFVNTLIMRTDLSGDPTFLELLSRVRHTALDAYAHQDLPYTKLVAELQPNRDASRTPLAPVMFSVINVPIPRLDLAGLTITPYRIEQGGSQFDMTLTIVDTESLRAVHLEYNTDLFKSDTIERLFGHYMNLLQGIVDNPGQRISILPLLSAAEYHQIVKAWNDTRFDFPENTCVHQLVEARVERCPDAVALSFEGRTMTYQELNARANCLAHYLQKRGVCPDFPVGLHLTRSPEMVVGLLGILKAGGCYLPLDPTYPADRLAFMVEDAGLQLLLTTAQGERELPEGAYQVICLDREWPMIAAESAEACPSTVTADNLAYTIYTSGSTGKPKGVLIPHRAVVNFLWSMKIEPGLTDADVLLSVTSLSFDIAVLELLLPLIVGARVELVSEAIAADGPQLLQTLDTSVATVMQATPTTWQMLLASGWRGRDGLKVLCGGEPLAASLAGALSKRCASLWNMFGPTETTVWSSVSRIDDHRAITVGRPINNTQMYILDAAMQPVPVGVAGDLYIGGLGLARGYLNSPELTAARFVSNPFDATSKNRLYRTGDRARYRVDGKIDLVGRTDHQIKLRGHRIELGEIENVLLDHPDVVQAAVVVSEGADEMHRHLIANLVTRKDAKLSTKALRAFLGEKLPGYMIPASFVYLDAMPVTPNGKVDRKALAQLETIEEHDQTGYIPPRDFVELRLVEIWQRVLDLRPIGVRDNFFNLGGHSLLAVRLFSELETQLGIKLPVVTLFQSPTIEQLGEVIKRADGVVGWDSLVPITTGGSELPFFCVHGVGGGVLDYADLAHLLGPEQPFYALQARGLDGLTLPDNRIEDMARYYVKSIRTVQPEGPYALGGYSFGGVVAFEMACQLCELGERVALLAMLETYAPVDFRWLWTPKAILRFLGNLPRWIKDVTRRYNGLSQVKSGLSSFRQSLTRRSVEAPELSERPTLVQAHLMAFKAYQPRIYPGHVTLFRVPGMALRRAYDPLFGWGEIAAGGVSVKMIPGAHYNILERPQVMILAEQLRESLAEARHQLRVNDDHQ